MDRGRKVVVEGVNRVYKHVRRSQQNPQGGRLSKEMPVSISNVLLVCEVRRRDPRGRALPCPTAARTLPQEVRRRQRPGLAAEAREVVENGT